MPNLHPFYSELVDLREVLRERGHEAIRWLESEQPDKVQETAEVMADIQALLAPHLAYLLQHSRLQLGR